MKAAEKGCYIVFSTGTSQYDGSRKGSQSVVFSTGMSQCAAEGGG